MYEKINDSGFYLAIIIEASVKVILHFKGAIKKVATWLPFNFYER
ncbi:hypothetical protein PALB_34540 [Pseudoalteromonas luteoviolacea B = ATCC 29581]|nr:hypothetical protein PALB_34540 [Pseudoalteromonas luteoviolacea B = ATCC 29581]